MTGKARILVIDDTPPNVKLLEQLLLASGYEVLTALSGAEGLEKVAQGKPDLVLLDVVMPKMSGYEVCRSIRANPATALLPRGGQRGWLAVQATVALTVNHLFHTGW